MALIALAFIAYLILVVLALGLCETSHTPKPLVRRPNVRVIPKDDAA